VDLDGRPFAPRSAAVASARARRFLAGRGHLEAKAAATATLDQAAATAAIDVRVTPGPVARTGDVRISGLDRTDPQFVRGLVGVREGEVLTQDRIDAATVALTDTGVFRSVAVEASRADDGAHDGEGEVTTDLAAAVREIVARTLDFEVGLGSYEVVRGRVRYLDRNFLGRAASLDAEVIGSYRGVSFGGRFEDPYLLADKVVFGLAARTFVEERPEFTESGAELEASLRHEFDRHVEVRGGYRLRATRATDVEGGIAGVEEAPYERAGGLFARVEDDRTDDPFFPRRGTIAALEAFWSTPALAADLDFLEVKAAVSYFVPLGERTVLAFAARASTREVLDETPTLPIQERIFLGGEDSVRSFEQDELAPLNAAGHAAGGLSAAELHAELRQRLYGELDGALFYDVGWVSPASFDLRGSPGQAIGIGIRYRLPVGPFRVDVAWNPGETYAANSRWAVHVSFGFAF
jgi:outer membrane protein assembly factor BamA